MGDITYLCEQKSSIKIYLSQDDFEILLRSLDFYKYLCVNFERELRFNQEKKKELFDKVDFTAQMLYSIYFDKFQKKELTYRFHNDIL